MEPERGKKKEKKEQLRAREKKETRGNLDHTSHPCSEFSVPAAVGSTTHEMRAALGRGEEKVRIVERSMEGK